MMLVELDSVPIRLRRARISVLHAVNKAKLEAMLLAHMRSTNQKLERLTDMHEQQLRQQYNTVGQNHR